MPVVLLAMAGCSDDDGDEGPGDGDSPAAETATDDAGAGGTPTAPTTSPPDLEDLPTVTRAAGAAADIAWDQAACPTTPGEQTVEGTLTNPTGTSTAYLVAISWTNDTSDTLARDFQVVRGVQPDEEASWEVTADVPEGVTQCVLFAQRGVIQK
ncbi:MAG: hypothetical protein JWN84_4372 [Nocardioides sp.]|nr:hypothetical protein [Nocardioides sp.]